MSVERSAGFSPEDRTLDRVFSALADPTRRSVLHSLGGGSRTVTELAEPHGMSLPGFMKHLAVLETAGLIARTKEGRVVRCALDAAPMHAAAAWLARYEQFWNQRLDALARCLSTDEPAQARPAASSAAPAPAAAARRPARRR